MKLYLTKTYGLSRITFSVGHGQHAEMLSSREYIQRGWFEIPDQLAYIGLLRVFTGLTQHNLSWLLDSILAPEEPEEYCGDTGVMDVYITSMGRGYYAESRIPEANKKQEGRAYLASMPSSIARRTALVLNKIGKVHNKLIFDCLINRKDL